MNFLSTLTPQLDVFQNSAIQIGMVQRSGRLSVLPLLGSDCSGGWASPYSGLVFTGVHGYGHVSFENKSDNIGILPLHMGYIQEGAQNHATSVAALFAPHQTRRFDDARCVQASQGGYLHSKEQWFFILPVQLRQETLGLRGHEGCGKIWDAIGRLNRSMGKNGRGHLDDLICKERDVLNVYANQFEFLEGQIGAIFFANDQPVGIEIAPTSAYFADIWKALITFCYGAYAYQFDRKERKRPSLPKVERAKTLDEAQALLAQRREQYMTTILKSLSSLSWKIEENMLEEKLLDMELKTLRTPDFYGQYVHRGSEMVYASLFKTGIGA
ncbi:MAG: hypothetical protein Q4D38_01140 [Planctomycetia bacterium]|nr:hypothetical protein [Planctomycetia bacterium]